MTHYTYDATPRRRHQGHASRAAYLALYGKRPEDDADEIERMKAEAAARPEPQRVQPYTGFQRSIDGGVTWEPTTIDDMKWFLRTSGKQDSDNNLAVVRARIVSLPQFGLFRYTSGAEQKQAA